MKKYLIYYSTYDGWRGVTEMDAPNKTVALKKFKESAIASTMTYKTAYVRMNRRLKA